MRPHRPEAPHFLTTRPGHTQAPRTPHPREVGGSGQIPEKGGPWWQVPGLLTGGRREREQQGALFPLIPHSSQFRNPVPSSQRAPRPPPAPQPPCPEHEAAVCAPLTQLPVCARIRRSRLSPSLRRAGLHLLEPPSKGQNPAPGAVNMETSNTEHEQTRAPKQPRCPPNCRGLAAWPL